MRACARDPQPGARASEGPAPGRETEPATDRPGGKVKGGARERTDRKTAAFIELRQLWRRPWVDTDDAEALAAFTAATRSGVGAKTILAAAKASIEAAEILEEPVAMACRPRLGESAAGARPAAAERRGARLGPNEAAAHCGPQA